MTENLQLITKNTSRTYLKQACDTKPICNVTLSEQICGRVHLKHTRSLEWRQEFCPHCCLKHNLLELLYHLQKGIFYPTWMTGSSKYVSGLNNIRKQYGSENLQFSPVKSSAIIYFSHSRDEKVTTNLHITTTSHVENIYGRLIQSNADV